MENSCYFQCGKCQAKKDIVSTVSYGNPVTYIVGCRGVTQLGGSIPVL